MEYVTLNNGVQMPMVGYGVFLTGNDADAVNTIKQAIDLGYRSIDTASVYGNEEAVSQAIKDSGIPREDFFITTKLWYRDAGYEATKEAFALSLKKLQTDYIDLYLIHQPYGDYYGAWRAMEELYHAGEIKAIGVSNFYDDRLVDLTLHSEVKPALNQRETHLYQQLWTSQEWITKYGIQHEAWSPLGRASTGVLEEPLIKDLATNYGKTLAQIILRWLVQRGIVVIPKSNNPIHMAENLDIFDFSLTKDEMEKIKELDRNQSIETYRHDDPGMLELLNTF